MDRNGFHLTHGTYEYHQWRPKWFLSLWYVWRKLCSYLVSRLILSPNRTKWASTWPMSLRIPSGAPKEISESMVHLAQTGHISCLEINTISKRTETSLHVTNITKKYHQVCLKRFLCLWYIRLKPCTYLALILTLFPNRTKWASTWHMSPRSTIWCAQNYFHTHGTFGANHAPI
jgi:hypothetical protein